MSVGVAGRGQGMNKEESGLFSLPWVSEEEFREIKVENMEPL